MEEAILRVKLAALKSEHRDLDGAIEALLEAPAKDQLQLARLKKRKLRGLAVLTNFKEEKTLWRGQIYDPKSGKTYRSVIRRKSDNVLEVKGCIGPFCQTQLWRKAR